MVHRDQAHRAVAPFGAGPDQHRRPVVEIIVEVAAVEYIPLGCDGLEGGAGRLECGNGCRHRRKVHQQFGNGALHGLLGVQACFHEILQPVIGLVIHSVQFPLSQVGQGLEGQRLPAVLQAPRRIARQQRFGQTAGQQQNSQNDERSLHITKIHHSRLSPYILQKKPTRRRHFRP